MCDQDHENRIELLINPEANQIIAFNLTLDGVNQKAELWKVEVSNLNFKDRAISFKATSDNNAVSMDSKREKGTLVFNGNTIDLKCDWSLFIE